MQGWSLRVPEEIYNWLREKAARETIERGERVSMNTVAVEIFQKAMGTDRKKGGR